MTYDVQFTSGKPAGRRRVEPVVDLLR